MASPQPRLPFPKTVHPSPPHIPTRPKNEKACSALWSNRLFLIAKRDRSNGPLRNQLRRPSFPPQRFSCFGERSLFLSTGIGCPWRI